MVRYWAIAVLALLPAAAAVGQAAGGKVDKDIKIQDKLTKDDPKDKQRGGPAKTHPVRMKAGTVYTIDMVSTEFDSYLRLLDKDGKQLDEDDDSGGNLNARIIFNCTKDGEYKVVCTSYDERGAGNYTLTVKRSMENVKLATAHAMLVGQAAPDFQGDAALNGKAVKLSDLKGKVVLLDFMDVRSGPCVAAIPRLGEWSKAYKADGLEVVGITFWYSEIGQKLGFDKETGKLHRLDEANKETDLAMLKEFAAYHKLGHLLMTLPKDEAVRTFDAFAVNGVPQVVLIDRQGVIRLIRVGQDKGGAEIVESEIKKLLAEK
jgi:thiol-disulfide isomerase/thioredoxin